MLTKSLSQQKEEECFRAIYDYSWSFLARGNQQWCYKTRLSRPHVSVIRCRSCLEQTERLDHSVSVSNMGSCSVTNGIDAAQRPLLKVNAPSPPSVSTTQRRTAPGDTPKRSLSGSALMESTIHCR